MTIIVNLIYIFKFYLRLLLFDYIYTIFLSSIIKIICKAIHKIICIINKIMFYCLAKMTRQEDQKHFLNFVRPFATINIKHPKLLEGSPL